MAHLQNIGDVPFVNEGNFVGTRGQSRRLEGFAIELTGPAASNFDVIYMAHLQNVGDTALFRNGQFCRHEGRVPARGRHSCSRAAEIAGHTRAGASHGFGPL